MAICSWGSAFEYPHLEICFWVGYIWLAAFRIQLWAMHILGICFGGSTFGDPILCYLPLGSTFRVASYGGSAFGDPPLGSALAFSFWGLCFWESYFEIPFGGLLLAIRFLGSACSYLRLGIPILDAPLFGSPPLGFPLRGSLFGFSFLRDLLLGSPSGSAFGLHPAPLAVAVGREVTPSCCTPLSPATRRGRTCGWPSERGGWCWSRCTCWC